MVYITRSGKRTEQFNAFRQEISDELLTWCLRLRKDTGIRWNSVYTMIQRALQLKDIVDLFCARWVPSQGERRNLLADKLDAQDWEELRHFAFLFKPLSRIIKGLEGHAATGSYGAVWEVLPASSYLFNKL